jgi:DNA-binding transcriptional ArsR family regulator
LDVIQRLLWWLLVGTRGGGTRARIINCLKEKPQNAHQLTLSLQLDYKTIRHHLHILEDNHIIITQGDGYAKAYFLSPLLESHYDLFLDIWSRMAEK